MLKLFLSSTSKDLLDARSFLKAQLRRKFGKRLSVLCHEDDSSHFPGDNAQDCCIKLVRKSDAVLLLIDRLYGSPFQRNRAISITHAEIREAKRLKKKIVPIVKQATWFEYWVWRRNKKKKIEWDNVLDPKVFLLLHEVSKLNCYAVGSMTDGNAVKVVNIAVQTLIARSGYAPLGNITIP